MYQLTEDQAVKLAESKIWESWTAEECAKFQIEQDLLCMDFSYFHKSIEEFLQREVFIHEFSDRERLRKEMFKETPPATFEDIISMIPSEKRIIIGI